MHAKSVTFCRVLSSVAAACVCLSCAKSPPPAQAVALERTNESGEKPAAAGARGRARIDGLTAERQPPAQNELERVAGPPLPPPTGAVVRVSSESQLQSAVRNVKPGTSIVLASGVYTITESNLSLSSARGEFRTVWSHDGTAPTIPAA